MTQNEEDDILITLPLRYFKEIALGYRYSSYEGKEADNLRDKCVLRKEVVEIIKSTQGYDKHFHIQNTGPNSLPLIWDKREWKESGERRAELNTTLDKKRSAADKLCELLIERTQIGKVIGGNALHALAIDYIDQDVDLSKFGIKKEEYM